MRTLFIYFIEGAGRLFDRKLLSLVTYCRFELNYKIILLDKPNPLSTCCLLSLYLKEVCFSFGLVFLGDAFLCNL